MNRKGLIIILFVAGCMAPVHAGAQFWKKWFKAEETPRSKPRPKKEPAKDLKSVTKPKRHSDAIEYPVSVMKPRYRIDLLLPLYLDELVKNNKPTVKDKIPDKALGSLNFYEGIKLAADTLSRLGYGVDVYVHDVTDANQTPEALIKTKGFETSDLIIGALPSTQLQAAARYAAEAKINFISALSPSDADIAGNAYFTLLQPTLQTHCERIRSAALNKHAEKDVFLFYRTNVPVDSIAYRYVLDDPGSSFKKISCNSMPTRQLLAKSFDSLGPNIILMPLLENTFAEELLRQLGSWFPQYSFEVYGMPSWKAMPSLKKADAYPNISVSFTEPFYFDMSTAAGQALANGYSKEFGGKAGEMVFRGYETLFWYVYLLSRYGTIFNPKQADNGGAVFTRFDVKPKWTDKGELLYNENQHLYLFKYQSGSFIIGQ